MRYEQRQDDAKTDLGHFSLELSLHADTPCFPPYDVIVGFIVPRHVEIW